MFEFMQAALQSDACISQGRLEQGGGNLSKRFAVEPVRKIQAATLQLADKAGQYLMVMPLRINLHLQDRAWQVCSTAFTT